MNNTTVIKYSPLIKCVKLLGMKTSNQLGQRHKKSSCLLHIINVVLVVKLSSRAFPSAPLFSSITHIWRVLMPSPGSNINSTEAEVQ